MSTTLARGNILNSWILAIVFNPASVAANTTAEQPMTVPGVRPGDYVDVSKPTNTAGLGICNSRVSANDTVQVTFNNNTAAPIDAASETYIVRVSRPDGTPPARIPGS